VQQNWELLQDSKFLAHSREADDAEAAYRALMVVLSDYKLNRYQVRRMMMMMMMMIMVMEMKMRMMMMMMIMMTRS
jgi:hypothetical protein